MRRLLAPSCLWLLLALMLNGCGGGGGGGTAVGSFNFRTGWSGPGGSELVTLQDLDGNIVKSAVINRAPGQSSTSFSGVPAGVYVIRVDLYELQDATGSKLGFIQAEVDVSKGIQFDADTGGAVSSVRVTPASISLVSQESHRFYATPYSSAGKALFTTSTSNFSWTVTGGIGSVDGNGNFVATTPGTGAVRALYVPTGTVGSAQVTVTKFIPRTGKWTILVYLNAANDLFQFSTLNVNQMERVAGNPDVRFVLQWKQSRNVFSQSTFDGTRRYLVQPDDTEQVRSKLVQDMGTGVDMGRPQTLKDFIAWAKANYPAQRYVMIVWNHGNGWRRGVEGRAVSYDDETGSSIQIWELDQAFAGQTFDMLAWDASLMQMMEVAYEVRTRAPLVIGSEESPPGEGYPYDKIFKAFRDTPDADARTLSKAFVDGMLGVPEYESRKITQSVVDTAKLPALATSLDALATQLIANVPALTVQIPAARDEAQSYSQTSTRYFRDIVDLMDKLNAQPGMPPGVQSAATKVRADTLAAIVWEGHNANSPGSNGLSIDFSPGARFAGSAADYAKMKFAQDTKWDEFLKVAP